ncbi:MAG: hypothetical protein IJ358_01365, partial [Clostridia bacterium]|nr:hypothetical protein [Clostridia bacterium]
MDTNSNKPTKRTGSVSTSPKSSSGRLSAEEKLKKSIKNLSYTSGGASGANLDTTKSSARSSS